MWRRFKKNKLAVIGILILLAVHVIAILSPVITPYSPYESLPGKKLQPPNPQHPFGTDAMGRDLLSRVMQGSVLSLMVGYVASILATSIGVAVGLFAGYYRGVLDQVLMRLTETTLVIPEFYLYVTITAVLLARNPTTIAFIIGLVLWTRLARIVRGQVLSLRERDFVKASIGSGAGSLHTIFAHMLPNCASAIIVTAALNISAAILTESALSFLGLSDPTALTWGVILMRAQEVLRVAWWVAAFPGIFIFLTAFGFMTVGDGVRDALDPRLRGA